MTVLDKDGPGLDVANRPILSTDVRLDRSKKRYEECSDLGKVSWDRALSETKYRFRHHYSDRELAATCVDPRLWGRDDFLSVSEQMKSEDISQRLLSQYVSFARKFQKTIYRSNTDEADGQLVMNEQDSSDEEVNREFDELKSKKMLQKVSKSRIDLVKTLKLKIRKADGVLKSNDELDLVKDYIGIDMGKLFLKLAPRMGEIVPFACSIIGANIAESFCEKEISAVKQIMTLKRTKLSDAMLEKLTVLKMNEKFMRSMRKSYPLLFSKLNRYDCSQMANLSKLL